MSTAARWGPHQSYPMDQQACYLRPSHQAMTGTAWLIETFSSLLENGPATFQAPASIYGKVTFPLRPLELILPSLPASPHPHPTPHQNQNPHQRKGTQKKEHDFPARKRIHSEITSCFQIRNPVCLYLEGRRQSNHNQQEEEKEEGKKKKKKKEEEKEKCLGQ